MAVAARLTAACVLSLLPLAGLAALDVAKSEIESTRGAKVSFVNYEGPQSVVESAAEIRGIGAALGAAIGKPDGSGGRAGDADRYSVIRAVDPKAADGLDADIILIGKDAVVDHIDNVRRVVAGYLEVAWGYSRPDAATLAVFITVYNAVHRGDMAYFGSKYKAVVMREISADNAGLATKWDEWPGRTRILIPLSSGASPGAAGAVSTGSISGKEVTQGMKSEPGAGIPDRQALVDIKQKEVVQAQDQAAKAKDAAASSAAKAADAQAQLAQAQKDLAAAQAGPQTSQAPAAAQGAVGGGAQGPGASPPAAGGAASAAAAPSAQGQAQQASATSTTPQVATAQQKVADAQKAADAAQADAAAKAAAARQADATVAATQAAVASDRQSIATDQNAAIAAQVAKTNAAGGAGGILLLEIVDAGYPFARVDLVDAKTGALIAASTLNSLRSRSLVDGGALYVAVAGKEGGTGAVRLVAIDKQSLAQTAQGEVDIFPESVVAKIGDAYYAVIKAGDGKYYLGLFGADLKEGARSKDAVNPYTFVVRGPSGAGGAATVVAQAEVGGFLSLDATSLATIAKLGL